MVALSILCIKSDRFQKVAIFVLFFFYTWRKSCTRHPAHVTELGSVGFLPTKTSTVACIVFEAARPEYSPLPLSICLAASVVIFFFPLVYLRGIGCHCRTASSSFLGVDIPFSILRVFSFVVSSFFGITATQESFGYSAIAGLSFILRLWNSRGV